MHPIRSKTAVYLLLGILGMPFLAKANEGATGTENGFNSGDNSAPPARSASDQTNPAPASDSDKSGKTGSVYRKGTKKTRKKTQRSKASDAKTQTKPDSQKPDTQGKPVIPEEVR